MADIYSNFRFRLYWRNRMVAGFSQLIGLKPTASRAFYEYLEEGSGYLPERGDSAFGTLTLQLGVSDDAGFYAWANEWFTQTFSSLDNLHPDSHLPEDVIIEITDEHGQAVRSYLVSRARITESEFAGARLDEDQPVAFERIILYNEGWTLI